MPYTVVQLASVTTTAGGTNSGTLFPIDDAANIYVFLNSTTTSGANAGTVQVEPTDTGTNWFPLAYNSSGASAITVSSSQGVVIPNVAFRQMRFVATGAMASTLTWVASKQITV